MDEVLDRMRSDWNGRAREDANYYVAFGRRDQDDEEFFSTAADVVRGLETELKRVEKPRRALEIGCGPGRLMKPMSRRFEEIHGVDVSDEMIRLARERLKGVPNAFVHHTSGTDLRPFADGSFDFVYSYAVFQHIPSRGVVMRYLGEAVRVLRPGGVLRCQINGLPRTAKEYTTWSGVRIGAEEVAEFARAANCALLALEGAETQYMWTTLRKRGAPRIRSVSNTFTGELAAPASGRFRTASLWIEHLPEGADLNALEVRVDGARATPVYLGFTELAQLNILLPSGVRTGMVQVEVLWRGEALCQPAWMRVIPAGPSVPRILSITDGVNLMSGPRIESRSAKIMIEEIADAEGLEVLVDGERAGDVEVFRTDPLPPRYEVNFTLPESMGAGRREVVLQRGGRCLARASVEVV
jgi:SAM-dependent methyltransferase